MPIKEKFEIKGKVALITGASKGIGAAIGLALAEHGAKVVISSRKKEGIDHTVNRLTKAGLNAHGIVCNVGDETQLNMLVDKTVSHFGGIDILVNNAATNPVYGPNDEIRAIRLLGCKLNCILEIEWVSTKYKTVLNDFSITMYE